MIGIPTTFDPEERILRVLYLPKHLNKNENNIKPGAFRPPAGKDEVSVVRLEYSSADFCKRHGKKNADPPDRKYFGFAIIHVNEIRSVTADIIFTPLPDNPAHSDITIGCIPEKGKPLPAEFQYKVDEMARIARPYKDHNPAEETWTSGDLK